MTGQGDGQTTLEGKGVSVGYGRDAPVVRDVDVAIADGRLSCLVGPNGAGKSTLLAALAGIVAAAGGAVTLGGREIGQIQRRERARCIGYLPQVVRTAMPYTVYEIVALGRYPRAAGLGFESEEDQAAIRRAMGMTYTGHLAERRFNEISGGERQRVLIASVLAGEPKVILLDEPTASLDITRSADIFAALSELAAGDRAVGVVTHDLNLAGRFADHVYLLSSGRVVASGTAGDVFTQQNLCEAYGEGFLLLDQPGSDVPAVLPAGRTRPR